MPPARKPVIAISSCLLGMQVRYDGAIKAMPDIVQHMQQHFELLAVCPEVEIGLGVPRPALQLSGDPKHPQMTGRDNSSINITSAMQDFCHRRPASLEHINGYIFKSRSPSCGLKQVPIFQHQQIIDANGRGLFADAMLKHAPNLPCTDEKDLCTETQRDYFVQQVLHYQHQRL